LRIDDHSFKIIPYRELALAGKQGNMFGGSKYHPHRDYVSGELVEYGDYYGSRNSARFMRCYVHTFGEDEYHSMRLELEATRGLAPALYHVLSEFDDNAVIPSWDEIVNEDLSIIIAESGYSFQETNISTPGLERWGQVIGAAVVGAFDFRDKSVFSERAHASRQHSRRFDWWQQFLEVVGGTLKPRRVPDPKLLPKTLRWVWRQWATSLAVLKHGLGDKFRGFLDTVAEFGVGKLDEYHLANIDYLLRHPDLVHDIESDIYPF
jgi:hypothetical protein